MTMYGHLDVLSHSTVARHCPAGGYLDTVHAGHQTHRGCNAFQHVRQISMGSEEGKLIKMMVIMPSHVWFQGW